LVRKLEEWSRTFDDPIPLPDGGKLNTPRDAGNYIAGLPKREHDAPARRADAGTVNSPQQTATGVDLLGRGAVA
jgi:hypothetical protein